MVDLSNQLTYNTGILNCQQKSFRIWREENSFGRQKVEVIDLAGNWNLVRSSDTTNRPIHIPGDIYSALMISGELPDPYQGENELMVQWP